MPLLKSIKDKQSTKRNKADKEDQRLLSASARNAREKEFFEQKKKREAERKAAQERIKKAQAALASRNSSAGVGSRLNTGIGSNSVARAAMNVQSVSDDVNRAGTGGHNRAKESDSRGQSVSTSASGSGIVAAAKAGAIAGAFAAQKAQESPATENDLPAGLDSLPIEVQKMILDSMAEASQTKEKSKYSPNITKKNGTGNYDESPSTEDTITFQNSDLKDIIQLSAGWSDAGFRVGFNDDDGRLNEEDVFRNSRYMDWSDTDSYWFKDLPRDESEFNLTDEYDIENLKITTSKLPDLSKPVEEWTLYEIEYNQMMDNYNSEQMAKYEYGNDEYEALQNRDEVIKEVLFPPFNPAEVSKDAFDIVTQPIIDALGIMTMGPMYLADVGGEWQTNAEKMLYSYVLDPINETHETVNDLLRLSDSIKDFKTSRFLHDEKIQEHETLEDILNNFPEYYYYKHR